MQDSMQFKPETFSRLANPLLNFAVATADMQLKAWQAYQVEGTHFVAKRLRANLEFLRSLGHCKDPSSLAACQRDWLDDYRKDYAEEWGRLMGTAAALGLAALASKSWMPNKSGQQPHVPHFEPRPAPAAPARPRPGLAA